MATDREQFILTYGFSQEYLEETKALWEPLYGKELSYQDAADIANAAINLEMFLRSVKHGV